MEIGDFIDIYPYAGKVEKDGELIAEFQHKTEVILDEVQAGGRIPLIIGRGLTAKAREFLGLDAADFFRLPAEVKESTKGFSLAQKNIDHLLEAKNTPIGIKAPFLYFYI